MINIAICDDEEKQIHDLIKIVSINMELHGINFNIFEFQSGESFIESITKNNYDIIFLDIEMNALNGIETAKIIRKYDKKSIIIFLTAYPDFVFQGYEVKASNYILKPYTPDKISAVLSSALEEITISKDTFYTIQTKSGFSRLNLSDVLYFKSNKRKIIAKLNNNKIEFYEKLDNIEKETPSFFIRVHQSYLVNINFISTLELNQVIINNESIPVSRKYKNDLMISFAKFILN